MKVLTALAIGTGAFSKETASARVNKRTALLGARPLEVELANVGRTGRLRSVTLAFALAFAFAFTFRR